MSTIEAVKWLYHKGRQSLEKGDTESARTRFQRMLEMTRDSSWVEKANAGLARVYLAENNYFWAYDHVRRALKRNPNEPDYHYLKGRIHLARQEWEEAASEALKAVEEDLENSRYYHLLGAATYHCESYRSARRFLQWAIECDPENPEPRFELAQIEVNEGNYQNALSLLKDSLELTENKQKVRDAIRSIQENWELKGVNHG